MRKEPMTMSRKCKFSASTSLKMWFTLPKLLIFFFVFTILSLNSVSSSATPDELSYADHCASIVPESTPKKYAGFDPSVLHQTGFSVGGSIRSPSPSPGPHYVHPNPIEFHASSVKETDTQDLFNVQGSLEFQRDSYHVGSFLPQSSVRYALSGFWSLSSGKLCMVGSGSIYLKQGDLLNDVPALLKLNNLMNFTSVSSLISGTLESVMSSQKDPNYFEPISILILPRMNYQYTLVSNISDDDSSSGGSDAPAGSLQMEKFCSALSGVVPVHEFDLKYPSHCLSAKNCTTPLSASGILPRIVALRDIECLEDKRRLRVLVEFADRTKHWYHRALYPNTTFVGEGSWNEKKNQLRVVACRFLDATHSFNNSHVGDCSIRLSLTFPGIWTIGDTRSIAGHIWSNKTVTDSGYFAKITFESHETYVGKGVLLKGQKYEYTQTDRVTKLCPGKKSTAANDHKTYIYPNPFPYDLSFNMVARNHGRKVEWGYSSPLSVGNQLYEPELYSIEDANSIAYNHSSSINNISYHMFINLGNTSVSNLISAEGIYNYTEGSLCMVGCRNLGLKDQQPTNDSVDCEILLNFQWPPINQERKNSGFFKGSIISTREKLDPLHFDRLELSSALEFMADSYWRVEVEITLVLIFTTLACVFGALQLLHVKRHPYVLPTISILMLLILTLGYMISLMYYFEAIFMDRQNPFLGSGGQIQLSQFILRVITVQTMVAFLLQLLLFQKIWSARSVEGTFKQLWDVEKAVSVFSIGFLAGMALLTNSKLQEHSILGFSGCGAYARLVVNGFLLPQILLNMVCKSKERALLVVYYTGTIFVQVLPYAYDLYRIRISGGVLAEPYIYASPLVGFYSTAWDAIIPIGGLLFAVIIFLQQKYGGRCFLPEKLRGSGAYDKVPKVIEA